MRFKTVLIALGIAAVSVASAAPAFQSSHLAARTSLPVGIKTAPAAPYFASLGGSRIVPQNIMNNLVVPLGSTAQIKLNIDRGMGAFQREVVFRSPETVKVLQQFYSAELARHAWSLLSEGAPPSLGATKSTAKSAMQILARHPGSDGFYWEVAISLSAVSTTESTFGVELRQLPDPD